MGIKGRFSNNINIRNRKASHEYHFLDIYVAGIVLLGSEIKSIREGKVSLQEAYCYFKRGELFIKGMSISIYMESTCNQHNPVRERKLLLKGIELTKLKKKSEEKSLTIIPIRLFVNDRGLAKLEISLAKGKQLHDKRESLKKKEQSKSIKVFIG